MENLFGKSATSSSAVEGETVSGESRRRVRRPRGLKFRRVYTTPGVDPFGMIEWDRRTSKITNPDGSTVFELKDIEVPKSWSQLATDILASKYFRKAGVPGTEHETSARQVVTRIARTLRRAGEELGGYFAGVEDADAFEAELTYMLITQIGAFNSPVWFNCGLAQEYGITGRPVGNWYFNPKTGRIEEAPDSYTRPQLSA
ncbi:MAG: vitamin B12-dependent ribonucleotide reductase, partial [Planctomycetota bacterium]